MVSDSEIQFIIKARNEAQAAFDQLSAQINGLSGVAKAQSASMSAAFANFGRNLTSIGNSMKSFGTQMSMAFTLPIVAVGGASIKMASDFASAMETVHTQAGASQQEVDSLKSKVLDLGKASTQGPTQLAEGLFHLESLGLRGASAMDALKVASEGAMVGGANLEDVTNALGGAIASNIKGAQDYNQAMGTLNATIGAGNMRMQDLVSALGTGILPTAKTFGLTLTDIGAALATMTDNAMPADQAATRLRMSISMLAAPTTKASQVFQTMGLGQLQLANDMRSGGLIKALEDLKVHLDNTTSDASQQADLLSQAFGGGRTSSGILLLMDNLDRLKGKYDQIGAQSNTFGEKVAAALGLPANQWKLFISTLQVDAIQIGNILLPLALKILQVLTPVINFVSKLTVEFQKLPGPVQTGVIAFIALLAAVGPISFILGTLLAPIGTLITFMAPLVAGLSGVTVSFEALGIAETAALGPIGLLIIALAGIGIAGFELEQHWSQVWSGMQSVAQSAGNYIVQAWQATISALIPPIPPWANYVASMATWVANVSAERWSYIETVWQATWNRMPDEITSPLQDAASKVESFTSWVAGKLSSLWDKIKGVAGDAAGKFGDIWSGFTNPGGVGSYDPYQNIVGPPGNVDGSGKPYHVYDRSTGHVTYYDANGNVINPFPSQGKIPQMPDLPPMPDTGNAAGDLNGLNNAIGGLGKAAAGATPQVTQGQQDLIALSQAFQQWHAQTGGDAEAFGEYLDAQKLVGQETQQVTDTARQSRVELRALAIVLGKAGISGEAFVAQQGLRALAAAFSTFKGTVEDFIKTLETNGADLSAIQDHVNQTGQTEYVHTYDNGANGTVDDNGVRHAGSTVDTNPNGPPGTHTTPVTPDSGPVRAANVTVNNYGPQTHNYNAGTNSVISSLSTVMR